VKKWIGISIPARNSHFLFIAPLHRPTDRDAGSNAVS